MAFRAAVSASRRSFSGERPDARAALARNIESDDYAVVLFWRDAAVLKGARQPKPQVRLLDEILSVKSA